MKKEWFDKLQQYDFEEANIIYAHDLRPYAYNKTLLYGYTCERETFHVYIKNEQIHTVVYNTEYFRGEAVPKNIRELVIKSNHDYVPDKRLYPERCDYNFCKLLKERGVQLPFTTWSEPVEIDLEDSRYPYYGFTLEDTEDKED